MEIWQMTQADYMNQNPGSDVSEHKAAIKQAIADGKPIPEEIMFDYPEFKKPRKFIPRAIAKPEPIPTESASPVPVEIPKPVERKMTFEERQNAEVKRINDRQNEEIRKMSERQDSELAKLANRAEQEASQRFSSIDEASRKQDEEIQCIQKRWDTELGRMTSASDEFNAKQDAEVARMKARWETEVNRSNLGGGISSSYVPQAQSEEEILAQMEQPGELEANVPTYNEPGSAVDEFTPSELMKLHLSRSRQARVIDEKYRARNVANANDQAGAQSWVRNPAKIDIEGIDTPRE
jgi:hypothetical protein